MQGTARPASGSTHDVQHYVTKSLACTCVPCAILRMLVSCGRMADAHCRRNLPDPCRTPPGVVTKALKAGAIPALDVDGNGALPGQAGPGRGGAGQGRPGQARPGQGGAGQGMAGRAGQGIAGNTQRVTAHVRESSSCMPSMVAVADAASRHVRVSCTRTFCGTA